MKPNAPTRPLLLFSALLLAALMLLAGCGLFSKPFKPALLKTHKIVFYLDKKFNRGMRLQVDIAFATLKNPIAQISALTPEKWFAGQKRDTWPYKQTQSFSQGQVARREVVLTPPPDCDGMVVFANYINLQGGRGQIVVFGAGAKEVEFVFITDKGIYR